MDYLYMLNRKLNFIEFLYLTAVQPFQSAMDAIQECRAPYNASALEDSGEPAFTTEWIEFNDGRLALGNLTLSMIAVVLQEFLAASAERMQLGTPPKLTKRSWLARYQVLIEEALGIDIYQLMSEFSVIEELILARNLTQHPGDIGTNWVYQDPEYARRYPRGEFVNRSYVALFEEGRDGLDPVPAPLEVTQEQVRRAIVAVRNFCTAMDAVFQTLPQYWN